WLERPILFVFPLTGALASLVLAHNVIYLSPRRHGVLHGGAHLLGRFRHARDFVLAIYDSVLDHDRQRSRSTVQPGLQFSRRRPFMFGGDGLSVFLVMLFSPAIIYSVFQGKPKADAGDY